MYATYKGKIKQKGIRKWYYQTYYQTTTQPKQKDKEWIGLLSNVVWNRNSDLLDLTRVVSVRFITGLVCRNQLHRV